MTKQKKKKAVQKWKAAMNFPWEKLQVRKVKEHTLDRRYVYLLQSFSVSEE